MVTGVWEEPGDVRKPEVTPFGLDIVGAGRRGVRAEAPQFSLGDLVGGGQRREPGGGMRWG